MFHMLEGFSRCLCAFCYRIFPSWNSLAVGHVRSRGAVDDWRGLCQVGGAGMGAEGCGEVPLMSPKCYRPRVHLCEVGGAGEVRGGRGPWRMREWPGR